MTVKPPSFGKLATVYGVSRQRLYQVAHKYGRATLENPEALLFAIVRSPLARVLTDPAQRRRIKSQIAKL